MVSLKEMAKIDPSRAIDLLLTFVEESIPTKSIYIKESENKEDYEAPASEALEKSLRMMAERLYKAKRKDGTPEEKVKEDLKQIAPYHIYQYIIDELHD